MNESMIFTHKTNFSGNLKGFLSTTTISSNKVFSLFNNRKKNDNRKIDYSGIVVERTWKITRHHKIDDFQFKIAQNKQGTRDREGWVGSGTKKRHMKRKRMQNTFIHMKIATKRNWWFAKRERDVCNTKRKILEW